MCNESNTNDNWKEIAKRITLLYDTTDNYHPQYEGYQQGTIIKQADTVLIAYPLLYKMSDAVKRNDLLIYENVTRQTGPAMTWQIHTINHIELNEIDQADVFFRKSYQNYIRPPFNVKWNKKKCQFYFRCFSIFQLLEFIIQVISLCKHSFAYSTDKLELLL